MSQAKKVAISQSNYVPWKGYFDLIASVDTFVLYDDMQYTKRDWRNRNRIKTPNGLAWLTVPVEVKGKYLQRINEVLVSDQGWSKSHWGRIKQCYSKMPYFKEVSRWLEPIYLESSHEKLTQINSHLIKAICAYLNIQTKIIDSSQFNLVEGKTERLIGLCKDIGATEYVSGPAAKNYIDPILFEEAGVTLSWADYTDYPEYDQPWGEFEHGVSILDLLFCEGTNSAKYMKHLCA